MRLLCKKYLPAALAAVSLSLPAARAADVSILPPVDLSAPALASPQLDAAAAFEALSALPAASRTIAEGRLIALDVDLASSPGFSAEMVEGRWEVRYRMAFNNIAEGWNWYPQADPQVEDYYHAKFLPLKSVTVERGAYDGEDKIGETQRMKVTWRYDYFLAFDNLYDFYPRTTDDDAGFVARLPASAAGEGAGAVDGSVRMLALARLSEPLVSESTTFWKATYGKPTDFTLKKRYVVGRLEEVWFYASASGKVLAKLKRRTPA